MFARLSCSLLRRTVGRQQCCSGKFVDLQHRYYAAANSRLRLDAQNVVSSGMPDITGYENVYLHDFIWEKMAKWSDKTALVCAATGRSYKYSQLRRMCGRLATSLRKCNLLPGDTMAVVLPNVPEFVVVVLAAIEANIRLSFINPVYTKYEIGRQVEISDSQAVVTTPAKYAEVRAGIQKNPKIKLPIIVVNDGSGPVAADAIKLDDLIRDDIEELPSQQTGLGYEDTIFLPFSSGTTGLPKAVELNHKNVVANLIQFSKNFCGVETTESYQDVVPGILPMYHAYGLIIVTLAHLRLGAKLVCMPQFSADGLIKMMENYQLTLMEIVPPIVQLMALDERITKRHVEHIRIIMSGAAPIGKESISKFQNRLNHSATFVQGYGLTETSPIISLNHDGPPESTGYLVPNTQMRIVKNDDENHSKNLGLREVGQIYVRGPQVMKGYYKNPQSTADTMDGDWLKTGDLGYYTEDGLLYVVGRLKELIKVKGYQVAPVELEEVIRAYDKIKDVAVIGVPHDKYGEIPKAFVVPKSGMKIDEDDLKKFVAERVAKFKQLGHVQTIDTIPKSAAGKILRQELQKL